MKKVPCLLAMLLIGLWSVAQEIYQLPQGVRSRVSSFENLDGKKGEGGKTNKTAKGNAFQWIKPGESKVLLDIKEQGIIQRIWCTINQSPQLLRSMRWQMFWDGSNKAAVDVPLGDFFVSNLGRTTAFESMFFSSPEGRSFNCYIPMPFRKGARVVITNESTKDTCKLYYDIDYVLMNTLPAGSSYFHAYWTRQMSSPVGEDFLVLPKVNGKGRFLGMSVGLNVDSVYEKTWWGEGEVKMYMDGDTSYPTIVGTGAEDYLGSGWGIGAYANLYQGCPVADNDKRQYVFYRWHIPDAVYFEKDLRVTLQQIGGGVKKQVQELVNKGVPLKPVSVDGPGGFVRLLEKDPPLSINDKNFPAGWVNFYRADDYAAVSYFYLNKPVSNLPGLSPVEKRTAKMQ